MSDDTYKHHLQKLIEEAYELGYLRGAEASEALLKIRQKQSMILEKPGYIIYDPRSKVKLDPEPYLTEKIKDEK